MDHRQHFYEHYTTAQSRLTSLDDARRHVENEFAGFATLVAPHLPAQRDARILDLGCGYGAFLQFLQGRGYTNTRGVDLSAEQVELATTLGTRNVEQKDLFTALAEETRVDVVTMFDVIEHLTRSEAITVLQTIHGILAPNGILILRTPNIDARLGSVLSFGDLTHELHLSKMSVLELFLSLPYASVDILPVPASGGGVLTRIIRALLTPILTVADRLTHIVQGISWSATVRTPNMIVIARRKNQ